MASMTGKEIVELFHHAEGERTVFEETWQCLSDNVFGRRDFQTKRTPGEVRNSRIYDSTAAQAAEMLSAGLDSLLTNSATRWFHIVPQNRDLLDNEAVAEWFFDTENKMYDMINRPGARFTPQMHEVYSDVVRFSTAGLFVEDIPGVGVRFHARPLSEMYLLEDHNGVITHFFRRYELTAQQVIGKFPGKVPAAEKDVKENKNPFAKHEFVQYVRPNPGFTEGALGPRGMELASTHVVVKDHRVVKEGGFHEQAYMTPRWSVDAGEVYGRGPGINSLPRAKMLNEMMRTIIVSAQKSTDPPLLMEDDSIVSQLRTAPGSVNIFRPTALGGAPVQSFSVDGRVDIGVEMLDRERTEMRNEYHSQLLRLVHDPRMTATGVIEASNTQQRIFSPFLGRFQTELLSPTVSRVFAVGMRQNQFLPPPEELQGTDFDVEYRSPIARAQKQASTEAITEVITIAANVADISPEILDNIDWDELWKQISQNGDVPPTISRGKDAVEEIRAARAEAQAAEQERAQMLEAAKVAPGVLGALGAQGQGQAA